MYKVALSYLIHLFTISGVVLSFLALIFAIDQNIPAVFFFLALALFVDGIDGTLARSANVQQHTPNINGEILDNIIDFLNYTFIPAFVIYWCGFVPEGMELLSASIVLIVSCYTFANNKVKTKDFYFSGFPALWNVVILYFYILNTSQLANFYLILFFSVLTFIPFKYIHPFRVVQLRKTSLIILLLWMLATIVLLYFPESSSATIILSYVLWAISNTYFLALTVIRTTKDRLFKS